MDNETVKPIESPKKTSSEKLRFILENQQKELRAYDQKAGSYIASNSGLFVIALFTLCIFGIVTGNENLIRNNTSRWWVLLVLTLVYIVLFCVSNAACLKVLFPRHSKKNENHQSFGESVTYFTSKDIDKDIENKINYTVNNIDSVIRDHIKTNVYILREKNKYCKWILPLSIAMGAVLFVMVILLFVF